AELVQAHRDRFGTENRLVADALLVHAEFREACGDRPGQEKLLREAVRIYEQSPSKISWRRLQALRDLAECYVAQRKAVEEAADLLRKALQLSAAGTVKRQTGLEGVLQLELARVLLLKEADSVEAQELLETIRATGLKNPSTFKLVPTRSAALVELGKLHRRAGRIREAVNAAGELRDLWPTLPELSYVAACEYAACIPLLGAAARSEREDYETKALECLQNAVRGGLKKNKEELEKDRQLDPLRGLPGFREIEERITSPRT
ncbi:MAG TPA: hypothetical protein VKE94_22050, partial [Gemmataceae bacterium]|nr:hypothetical protein [Gemmataceae bacterium]